MFKGFSFILIFVFMINSVGVYSRPMFVQDQINQLKEVIIEDDNQLVDYREKLNVFLKQSKEYQLNTDIESKEKIDSFNFQEYIKQLRKLIKTSYNPKYTPQKVDFLRKIFVKKYDEEENETLNSFYAFISNPAVIILSLVVTAGIIWIFWEDIKSLFNFNQQNDSVQLTNFEDDFIEIGDDQSKSSYKSDIWSKKYLKNLIKNKKMIENLYKKDSSGHTAQEWAFLNNHSELVTKINNYKPVIKLHTAGFFSELIRKAIREDNIYNLLQLVENDEKNSALLWSAKFGKIEFVKKLLESPYMTTKILNHQDIYGCTALIWASMFYKAHAIVKLLVNSKHMTLDGLNKEDKEGRTALIWAIHNLRNESVEYLTYNKLMNNGGFYSVVNKIWKEKEQTPLMYAAFILNNEALRKLLENPHMTKKILNRRLGVPNTPLMVAIVMDNTLGAKLILSSKHMMPKDFHLSRIINALTESRYYNSYINEKAFLEVLKSKYVTKSFFDSLFNGKTALMHFIYNWDFQKFRILLKHDLTTKSSLMVMGKDDGLPLLFLIIKIHGFFSKECLELLLSHKYFDADVINQKNRRGENILQYIERTKEVITEERAMKVNVNGPGGYFSQKALNLLMKKYKSLNNKK